MGRNYVYFLLTIIIITVYPSNFGVLLRPSSHGTNPPEPTVNRGRQTKLPEVSCNAQLLPLSTYLTQTIMVWDREVAAIVNTKNILEEFKRLIGGLLG